MTQNKPGIVNVPNALTLLRLILIPVFVWLMIRDRMMWALGVFAFASFTDILDGWIARRFNLITDVGKLMDPLADKLMVLSVMIAMAVKGIIPWAVLVILFVKEGLMVLGGLLLLSRKVVVSATGMGKIAQFFLVISLVLCFFHAYFSRIAAPVHLWALWFAAGLSVLSLLHYVKLNGPRMFRRNPDIKQADEPSPRG